MFVYIDLHPYTSLHHNIDIFLAILTKSHIILLINQFSWYSKWQFPLSVSPDNRYSTIILPANLSIKSKQAELWPQNK